MSVRGLGRSLAVFGALVAGGLPAQEPCRPGSVWREAFYGDWVCVPHQTYLDTQEENRHARENVVPHPDGPQGCRSDSAWRNAFPATGSASPATRRQVREDNAAAPGRTGVLRSGPNGPRQCLPGFVWREAGPNDFACVPPDSRTLARRQNAEAPDRTGSDVCKPGLVWREAVPEDHVCVSIQSRERARADNGLHWTRRLDFQCDAYARLALDRYDRIGAYRLSGCFDDHSERWHGSWDDHYDWCIRVTPDQRAAEIMAREEGLAYCRDRRVGAGTCRDGVAIVVTASECLDPFGHVEDAGGRSIGGCGEDEDAAGRQAKAKFFATWGRCVLEDPAPGCCTVDESDPVPTCC
ncbi:MAG: hypothetical protein R2991_16880 [Thermoanaerobaculia bacterium]